VGTQGEVKLRIIIDFGQGLLGAGQSREPKALVAAISGKQ
jgi:hypothetical protein